MSSMAQRIEAQLREAGIMAEAIARTDGQVTITDIALNAGNALAEIEVPFTIPSLQAEKWLAAVLAGDTEGARKLEVGVQP